VAEKERDDMTTPADTLTTAQQAGIVTDADPSTGISFDSYSAVSADPTIASIGVGSSNTIMVVGQSAGEVDVTVTRLSDSETAPLHVTVVSVGGGAFAVHLGGAVAK
jgi:hypothetical protein